MRGAVGRRRSNSCDDVLGVTAGDDLRQSSDVHSVYRVLTNLESFLLARILLQQITDRFNIDLKKRECELSLNSLTRGFVDCINQLVHRARNYAGATRGFR